MLRRNADFQIQPTRGSGPRARTAGSAGFGNTRILLRRKRSLGANFTVVFRARTHLSALATSSFLSQSKENYEAKLFKTLINYSLNHERLSKKEEGKAKVTESSKDGEAYDYY